MKKTSGTFAGLFLSVCLCFPLLCFGQGIDGVFWGKMDKVQKALVVTGYKMGSMDAILTLNTLIALNEQAAKQRSTNKNPELEELSKIDDAKFKDRMNLTRKFLIKETYIPEEDVEKIVTALDAFYSTKVSLPVPLSDAISKIREEMYKNNPGLERILKTGDTDHRK